MRWAGERLPREVQELGGGRRVTAGDGSGPPVAVSIDSRLWAARIAAFPETALGDAYMAGAVNFERGYIYDLLALAGRNMPYRPAHPPSILRRWLHDLATTRNARRAASANARHHYDVPLEVYRRFLDADLQYSCAYFEDDGYSLDQAQEAKKRHIAAKLFLDRADLSVLDIGSGWGGLALDLARDCSAKVLGVTLSEEQIALSRTRAQKAGLADRCRFELVDYRALNGTLPVGLEA